MNASLDNVPCLAKYLCDKPDGIDYCHDLNHDYHACPHFSEENVMFVKPKEIHCTDACRCKYTGIRNLCNVLNGHDFCGTTASGKIPEGDIPDSRLAKIRKVIPKCALETVN